MRSHGVGALALLLSLTACTEAGLQPLIDDAVLYVDDKLTVAGQFCTSPSDEVAFPVKLLIVIDQSASLQCTDPANNRLTALNLAGADLDVLPNVEFGVIGFASWTRITEFTTDWATAGAALAPASGQGGPATDYQGALSTVLRVLEQDMVAAGPAVRARTKYEVLFLSDGVPEPRCRSGCNDGDTTPDSLYGVCNYTGDIPEDVYVDMLSQCPDYNQPIQVLQKVQDIIALGDFYGVGEIRMNTILLFAPADVVAQMCGDVTQFGYVREEAEPLLRSMAAEGGGTFRDVNISTDIDFLDFDYESLRAPYEMVEFFGLNVSALSSGGEGALPDSDMDGLEDSWEFDHDLERLERDSDGDRFSDFFEVTFQAQGFDPLDGDVPAIGCLGDQDRDGDGLLECEEVFLGTDPQQPDSDGDRIDDGVELRMGTDPTVHDTLVDHDFDGRLSGFEIKTGTSPQMLDGEDALLQQVRYSVTPGPLDADDVRCYDFSIQGLTLAPTLSHPWELQRKGTNRILIFAQEAPGNMGGDRGVHHVACVEARYLGDTFKDPISGQIVGLSPERFVEVQVFDPDLHCLGPGDDPASALPE